MEKKAAQNDLTVQIPIAKVAEEQDDTGRILVYEFATGPVVRVMMESSARILARSIWSKWLM